MRWNNPKRFPSRPLFLGISNWMFTRYMHQNNLQSKAFKLCKLCKGNFMEYKCQKLVRKKPFQIQRLYIPFLHHDPHRFRCYKDGWLDSHDPLFQLQMSGQQISGLDCKPPCQPCSAPEDLDAVAHDAIDKVGEITTLTDWAYPVETCNALTITQECPKSPETFPLKSLPKRFWGRCKPQVPKKRPGSGMVHIAWRGHFKLDIDCHRLS